VDIELIRSIPRLEALRDAWNALADRLEGPLLRHEWFASCARVFSSEDDLRVVTVWRGSELAGAAPLTLVRGPGGPRLEFLGMSALHEPSGFLFADDQALRTLLTAVVELRQPMLLQRMDADSRVPSLLRRVVPRPGVIVTRPTAPSLAIAVNAGWDAYHGGLSSRITGNLRRLKARAARVGDVQTQVLTPTESEVGGLLNQVMAVEGSGWKGRQGSALSRKPPLRAFFDAYSRRAAHEGILRIALLRFGERVAAVELSVEAYRRWWQLKIGYDEELARFYPGLQLVEATIRYAFEQGLDSYEFLGSAASWEEHWRPEARHYCMTLAYPASLAGVRALSSDAISLAARRLARLRRPSSIERR